MSYRILPINVVGQHYKSRSLPLSAQTTINLYPEVVPEGRTPTAMHNWPGTIRRLTSSASGTDRGSHEFNGILYKVTGDNLYRVSSEFVETLIGTVSGSQRCIMADDGSNLVITTGSKAYLFNGLTLSEITDSDLEAPTSVAVLNNQFIFDGDGGRWVSATPGDPSDIPALNYASAESNGDALVRVYVFNQVLFLFGTRTVEPWFNSGVGSPPFTRVDGGIIEDIGLYAAYSVANTNSYMYFLGSDKNFYRVTGYQAQNITPPGESNEFFKLSSEDVIGSTASIDGQNFYIATFPTADKTYAFSEELGYWIQLSSDVNGGRHIMNSYQFIYGKRLINDYRNGNVLEFDLDTFVDDTSLTQLRQRDTSPINGVSLNLHAQKLIMDSVRFILHTGIGLASGQGSAPVFKIGTSIDGGRTFDYSGSPYIDPGASGNYTVTVRLDKILEFEDLIIRIKVTDPVFVSIHGAAISVDKAGEF